MTRVVINGDERSLAAGTSLESLVAEFVPDAVGPGAGDQPKGVAVAVNDTVVPRTAWSETVV
ncbi:MAG: sulfur carrier protein ThiS, partial [Nocardioidaceae bacterium]